MIQSLRDRLGVYGRESYFVPVLMVIFGVVLLVTEKHAIEWSSHLSGFALGAGVMGLLYRHVYKLSSARKGTRDSKFRDTDQ